MPLSVSLREHLNSLTWVLVSSNRMETETQREQLTGTLVVFIDLSVSLRKHLNSIRRVLVSSKRLETKTHKERNI